MPSPLNRQQTEPNWEAILPRRSAASFSVLSVTGQPERLRPPPDLTELERKLFVDLVMACPADYFRASDLPLLCGYVRSLERERKASAHLEAQGEVVDGHVNPWLSVLTQATKSVLSYAHKLRLSPQSRAPNNPKRPITLSAYERMALEEGSDGDEAPPS